MTAFFNHDEGDLGIRGVDEDDGAFIPIFMNYTAASADQLIAVMPRAVRVRSVVVRPTVAGTDGGAVTVAVRKVPSGTAIASGTILHSGTGNRKGTINTNQNLTLAQADCNVAAGESIALDFSGTLTAAVGAVTVMVNPR
jgi:hypothetical protein